MLREAGFTESRIELNRVSIDFQPRSSKSSRQLKASASLLPSRSETLSSFLQTSHLSQHHHSLPTKCSKRCIRLPLVPSPTSRRSDCSTQRNEVNDRSKLRWHGSMFDSGSLVPCSRWRTHRMDSQAIATIRTTGQPDRRSWSDNWANLGQACRGDCTPRVHAGEGGEAVAEAALSAETGLQAALLLLRAISSSDPVTRITAISECVDSMSVQPRSHTDSPIPSARRCSEPQRRSPMKSELGLLT